MKRERSEWDDEKLNGDSEAIVKTSHIPKPVQNTVSGPLYIALLLSKLEPETIDVVHGGFLTCWPFIVHRGAFVMSFVTRFIAIKLFDVYLAELEEVRFIDDFMFVKIAKEPLRF